MHLRQHSAVAGSHGVDMPGKDRPASPRRAPVPVLDDLLERAGLTGPAVAIAVGLGLLLLHVLSVYADGFQFVFGYLDFWKGSVEPIAILTYVLLVHYFLDVSGRRAVRSIRPVIALDDAAFDGLVARMSATILRYQWVPMVVFAGLSVVLLGSWDWPDVFLWNALVSRAITLAEYALIGSAIYLVVARNRFFTRLFEQPMNVDVFNPAPIRPMGRWGLSVAAAIMGGVTISVLLVGNAEEVLSFEHLPMYLVATAAAVVSFFGSMSSTRRVLVQAKARELNAIRANLSALYAALKQNSESGRLQGMDDRANAITAWLGYEKRINEVQEWPYTANTLRGLLATVLLPIALTVVQQVILWQLR
jgi:hypothetical protein